MVADEVPLLLIVVLTEDLYFVWRKVHRVLEAETKKFKGWQNGQICLLNVLMVGVKVNAHLKSFVFLGSSPGDRDIPT